MDEYWNKVVTTAAFLSAGIGGKTDLGLMTGTGLGKGLSALDVDFSIDYSKIPGFPLSTVVGHAGRLLSGRLAGKRVVAMEGRFHLYEGYTPREVSFPVRVMQALGVKTLVLTNAAGGLNPAFSPGDIMLINDHINLTGENPLLGPNDDRWGVRFPDMTESYSRRLAGVARSAAGETNLSLKEGIYAGIKGPSLETNAETRFLRMIGADAVGMSTIQEVIAAVHAGMDILGLSTITNVNDPDRPKPATLDEIIDVADRAAPRIALLLTEIAGKLDG